MQISDGQIQVPIIHSRTTLTTSISGAVQRVVLPAANSIATPTTIPVRVNGRQPSVAVIDPSGIISFLPPNDILVVTSVITENPAGFRVGTQEVVSGKPAVTMSGEIFSLGPQGLYIDGIPKTLTGANAPRETTSQSTLSTTTAAGVIDDSQGNPD